MAVTQDDVRRYVGQRVTLRLATGVKGGPAVTGLVTRVIDAADGAVVFLEPADAPGTRVSYHYHYIQDITPG